MIHVGFLIFPDIQQLDLAGPYEVFTTARGVKVDLVWKDTQPVRSFNGISFQATQTFSNCPQLDVICVPGGGGTGLLMEDAEVIAFIRQQAQAARYITSVCTGSLVLGATGLLEGRRATCHWAFLEYLTKFGAYPIGERVVRDGNVVTAAGVSAGIDFALSLLAEIVSREEAEMTQLWLEYAPQPPFESGNIQNASVEIVNETKRRYNTALTALDAALHKAKLS